jgi:hypothetical protein
MNITEYWKTIFGFSNPSSTEITAPVRSIIISGHNEDVDAGSVPEAFWQQGGPYNWVSAAGVVSVVSTSASDTSAGTGARVVLIEGLDSNYKEIFETIKLNGTTPVNSTQSFYRVNFLRTVSAGTGKKNAGAITASIGGSVVANAATGNSYSQHLAYTVPANHVLFLCTTHFTIARTASANISAASKVYVPSTNTIVAGTEFSTDTSGSFTTAVLPSLARIPEKCDFWYDIEFASTTNLVATGSVRALLVKNSYIPKFIS